MPCPQCGGKTGVYDSRLNMQKLIRRRRGCEGCGFRFATIEIMNEYHPLGKKEKANAPIPKPPPRPKVQRESKPRALVTRRVTTPPERLRSIEEDIVPWVEDREDYSAYIDIPRGFNDD